LQVNGTQVRVVGQKIEVYLVGKTEYPPFFRGPKGKVSKTDARGDVRGGCRDCDVSRSDLGVPWCEVQGEDWVKKGVEKEWKLGLAKTKRKGKNPKKGTQRNKSRREP